MTAHELLESLRDQGVTIRLDGDLLRLFPAEAVPAELADELRHRKPEILAELSKRESEPVTSDERRAAYEQAVAEANRQYRGGPIDWPAVDSVSDRIHNAQTRGELDAAVRHYLAAVVDEYGWALGAFPLRSSDRPAE